MAGIYVLGETKTRPGSYFNIQKKGTNASASVVSGVTAVLFRSDFGPLCKATELEASEGYEGVFGTGGTTDAMAQAVAGGAKTLIAVRVGTGGTAATCTLNDSDGSAAVTLTAKYPGSKSFTATVREKLSDSSMKELVIYSGTTQFEKVEFASGDGEAQALADAMAGSKNFIAAVESGAGGKALMNVSQSIFTAGSDPTATVTDYASGAKQVKAHEINTLCVDTEDTAVHALIQSFVNSEWDNGNFIMAVVAEKHTVDLDTRKTHAAAFNDNLMHYVLNAYVGDGTNELDGYQTAARIAGMIGAVSSSSSLTHTVINGYAELLEPLDNSDIIDAEKKGCIVLSLNRAKQVWIDSAINTLITPADNQDDGWKKIRRTKTRIELIRRVNDVTDALVGKVDNDSNGRLTIVSQVLNEANTMIAESKLVSVAVSESSIYKADGDSAWFDIEVVDKDSAEHIYLSFMFQFSTNE